MNNALPLVSIGLPCYNEEKFLEQTLNSLLEQDYENIEITISDNASTDSTPTVCNEYRDKFPQKIKYNRNENNIGALINFKKVFELSKGDFFMWAGAHDLYSKNYIASSVKIMQSNQNVVVVYPLTVWIDYNGNKLEKVSGFIDTRGNNAVARFNQVLWANQHALYGLMRPNALKKLGLNRQSIASGAVLLGELSLLGDFAYSPHAIWYRRESRETETSKQRISRYNKTLYTSKNYGNRFLPHWRIPFEFLSAIWKSPLSFRKKVELTLSGIPGAFVRYGSGLFKDLIYLFSK